MDNRAVTPVVEKTLTIGIVVLYLAGATTVVFGGVVPDYRTATGDEVADRALAGTAVTVERAVPPTGVGNASSTAALDLPATIRGAGYRVRADGRHLVLDHPTDHIDERTPLALPPATAALTGAVDSGSEARVRVVVNESGVWVVLEEVGS